MPPVPPSALRSASLALAFLGVAVAPAGAQVQTALEDYELRMTYGSPPGSGAGNTGYVSARPPAAAAAAAKGQPVAPAQTPPRASIAERARQAIERDEVTGTVPRTPVRPRVEEEEPFGPVGVRAGSFNLRPSIEIYGGYDDNPFRTGTERRPSTFTKTEARLEFQSDWSRHELAGELRGAYTDYLQTSGNDRPEAEARLRGRIDVSSQSRIELEGRAALTTDAAGSPDAVASAKRPPHNYEFNGSAAFFQRFNRLELGLRGSVERRLHQNADLLSGVTLDRSDRDYTAYGLALRGSYESTPDMKPFVEAGIDRRVFDHRTDFGGIRRGSDGFVARAGVEFARERVLSGEASAGYAWRSYEDPALRNISGLIFDASLIWRATGLTTVTLRANSEIGETTLAGASGVFNRQASVTIDHAFRRWLIGSLGFAYGIDDYRGAGRRDDRMTASAGLTYHLNRYAAIKAEARYERLRSNVPGDDYSANVVMLGLRLQR